MPRHSLALLAAGASLLLGVPAQAQHQGHMPGMTMPTKKAPARKAPAKKAPAKKAAAAKKPPAKKAAAKATVKKAPVKKARAKQPAVRKAAPPTAVDPHAGHAMPATPPAAADPHAGHDMPATPPPPPAAAADPHAGHAMGAAPDATPVGTDLPAGNAPPPPVPTDHAADRIYGSAPMEMGRHHLDQFHGGQKLSQVMFNLAELQLRRGRDGFEWDGEAWYGGDIDRLMIKSEGEGEFGRSIEQAEVQALWSHAIDPYFNLQAGVRYDFKPNPSRAYAVLGVEGMAPSFFDVEGAVFLSNKGELMARAEGYYDQRITQRLILQPSVELNFAAQDSRELGIGSGLSDAEIALRLRYDIRREFAPYVGVKYNRAFGDTRRFLREDGEGTDGWSLVTGIRAWF